jgi:outer membrane receptor protein involved in Fe transport
MDQAPIPPEPPAIVVTARGLPDPGAERAFSVITFDRKQLEHSPNAELDQILKQVPGLQLFRRSDARSGHPTSQGVTLRALGGNASSRALLVLDGVPQSDPFGGWVNWPAYDPQSLASVRVVRGGGSVAHGAGALAGTIELASDLSPGLGVAVETGSRDSLQARAHGGVALGSRALGITASLGRGDGFIPVVSEDRGPADRPAAYRNASIRARFATPVGGAELQASVSGFRDERERGLAFTDNRTDGLDASLRLVGRGEWQWSALAYGQWRELQSSFASVNAQRTAATRASLQDSVPSQGLGGSVEVRPSVGEGIELRLGGDVRWMDGESRELYTYVAGEPTRRRRAGGDSGSAGIFGEVTARLDAVTLSGGLRADRWTISNGELVERQIATGALLRDDRFEDRSGTLPTARAGAVLELGRGLSLRSAAYLGWRLPTLNELFRPFRAGADATAANPLLEPERLGGVEIGAGMEHGGVTLSLTAFSNRIQDAIANVTIARGPGVFPGVGFVGAAGEYRQRQNLDAVRVRGIEASGEAKRGPWSLGLGYSFADAHVEADGEAAALDGLRPAQTPRHMLSAQLGWESKRGAVALQLRRVGGQFEDDLNSQLLSAATTLDAFAATPLTRDLQLVFRGENLTDERVIAGISGDDVVERATPRTLWLGLRLSRFPAR